jgi:hypothetical protein
MGDEPDSKKPDKKSPGRGPWWPSSTELFLLVVLVSKVGAVVHQVSS